MFRDNIWRHSKPCYAKLLLCAVFVVSAASAEAAPIGFKAAKLAAMDAAITNAIAEKKLPGGVLWLERQAHAYHRAYGNCAVEPQTEPMREDTIFDLASLTKVVATTPAIMLLVERGQMKLEAPAHAYLTEFQGEGTVCLLFELALHVTA